MISVNNFIKKVFILMMGILMYLGLSCSVGYCDSVNYVPVYHIVEGGSINNSSDWLCATEELPRYYGVNGSLGGSHYSSLDDYTNYTYNRLVEEKATTGSNKDCNITAKKVSWVCYNNSTYKPESIRNLNGSISLYSKIWTNLWMDVVNTTEQNILGSFALVYEYSVEKKITNNTLKVYIDYVSTNQSHLRSYDPSCTSYTNTSKLIYTMPPTTLNVGADQKVYVPNNGTSDLPGSPCSTYVGPDKALHIQLIGSDATKVLNKSGYTYSVTLDSDGNVTVVEPEEYFQFRKVNDNVTSKQKAHYNLSELNGELHFVVERNTGNDNGWTKQNPDVTPITPDPPDPPDVYEYPITYVLEHKTPHAVAKIKSDDVENEKYNNLHVGEEYFGIPTSETQYCYLEITANMYRLKYNRIEGKKQYTVKVTKEYKYQYKATENGKEVDKTGTHTISGTYNYYRKYVYYEVLEYDAYQLLRADVVNETLTGAGRITMFEGILDLENGVRKPNQNVRLKEESILLTASAESREDAIAQGIADKPNLKAEAESKVVLVVENDEIYHGETTNQYTGATSRTYIMESSLTTVNNETDVAETKSPAETANQNILSILRWLIKIPTTVANEEYPSQIEAYYQRVQDNLVSGIRGSGVKAFPSNDPPDFLQKVTNY